jgi:hypothetical protein
MEGGCCQEGGHEEPQAGWRSRNWGEIDTTKEMRVVVEEVNKRCRGNTNMTTFM